jgi:hypothetical protein
MGKGVLLGVVAVCGLFCSAGITQPLIVPDQPIYIGQPFSINVSVPDTLIVLNLRDPAKVYEFKIEQPGEIELCFVRACDHPCARIPMERVILANPRDTILFTLKQTPMEQEIRRSVLRAKEGETPEVLKAALVEVDGKSYFQIKVKHIGADLSCDQDNLSASFYVFDPQKGTTLTLRETGPATGEFEAAFPMELGYDQRKFTVKYASNEVTVELPNLPKAVVKIGDEEYVFDLVKKVDEKALAEIPQQFRLGDCCSLALIEGAVKCHFAPTAQVNVELIGKKLYVIAKDGCQYYAGVKDVVVLDPVRLVVKDEKGQEFHGGRLDAGKKYTIEAINGLPDSYILVVSLSSGKVVSEPGKGASYEWTPGQEVKGTVAIIYVDQYFCNPLALIFEVD